MLSQTINAGLKTKTVEQRDLEQVVVDTKAIEKAIAHPTESRLYNRSRERLAKQLKNWLGHVVRDVERKTADRPDQQAIFSHELALTHQLLKQQRHDKRKLYSLHAPEVECIRKGKMRKSYEFGVKISVATTLRSNFVLVNYAMPGNPYDGHASEDPAALFRNHR